MAKFTRTAYASGSLRELAQRIAAQAQLTDEAALVAGYENMGSRKTRFLGKRVRITILVETEAPAPKKPRDPKRPRPVQQALPLDPPASTELARALGGLMNDTKYRMPLYGAGGGAT